MYQEKNKALDTESKKQKGFHGLSQSEKDKVEEILFLLDKFYVSDEFYQKSSCSIVNYHDPI